jgi:hypothetical protein
MGPLMPYRFHVAAKHQGKLICLCALAFLAGNVLLLSSASSATDCLFADRNSGNDGRKIIAAWRGSGADRFPLVFNGLVADAR